MGDFERALRNLNFALAALCVALTMLVLVLVWRALQ